MSQAPTTAAPAQHDDKGGAFMKLKADDGRMLLVCKDKIESIAGPMPNADGSPPTHTDSIFITLVSGGTVSAQLGEDNVKALQAAGVLPASKKNDSKPAA